MELLLEQLKYNHWANCQFIKAINQLEPNQSKLDMKSSFPSIHETLGHMLWVEEMWLERWQGHFFNQVFDLVNYPTIEFIDQQYVQIFSKQIQFIESIKTGSESIRISYVNFKNETWEYSLLEMVQHLIFHSSFHRGQLATMLRQLGEIPPGTDYLIFVDEELESKA